MRNSIFLRIDEKKIGLNQDWNSWIELWKKNVHFSSFDLNLISPENSEDEIKTFFIKRKSNNRLKPKDIIINFTSPLSFFRVNGVMNGGYFYGNGGKIPSNWIEKFEEMDFILVPSFWHLNLIEKIFPHKKIFKIPFPIAKVEKNFLNIPIPWIDVDLAILKNDYFIQDLDSNDLISKSPIFLAETKYSTIDGFPIILSEWFRYKKKDGNGILIFNGFLDSLSDIKIKSKIIDFLQMIYRLMRKNKIFTSNIYLIPRKLSKEESCSLLSIVDCMVSASHESTLITEKILEVLFYGKPIIIPSHSEMRDILPVNYPLTISCTVENCAFISEEDELPMTNYWFIQDEGTISEALHHYCKMTKNEKSYYAQNIWENVNKFYSENVIISEILNFLNGLK